MVERAKYASAREIRHPRGRWHAKAEQNLLASSQNPLASGYRTRLSMHAEQRKFTYSLLERGQRKGWKRKPHDL